MDTLYPEKLMKGLFRFETRRVCKVSYGAVCPLYGAAACRTEADEAGASRAAAPCQKPAFWSDSERDRELCGPIKTIFFKKEITEKSCLKMTRQDFYL